MNLHGIVAGAISTVNPMVQVCLEISDGSATNVDGTSAPKYLDPVYVKAQVQPLSGGDLRHVDSLNLQGDYIGIYLFGNVQAISRPDNKGGDKITFPDRKVYLVTLVLETWPDWCKIVGTRQDE